MSDRVGSDKWQHQRYMELTHDRDAYLEHRVRHIAHVAATNHRTFESGMIFPYRSSSHAGRIGDLDRYHELHISIHPWLASQPKVAQLIIEEMLRDQIARLA